MGPPPPYIAKFDSSSAMVRALGRYLHGKDFPGLQILPSSRAFAALGDLLGRRASTLAYIWGGWTEAISPDKLGQVRAEGISRWTVEQYPKRMYQAAMIGSSNGAATHLCAALDIPWLPQTFLVPVRHPGLDIDEPKQFMEWGREQGRTLLEANPDLTLHHMHDAVQDRLMVQRMTYFRVKRARLGETYSRFLEEQLLPGATIYLLECHLPWPTTQVGERHYFQSGALGGATPNEYLHGSDRVAEYLEREGSSHRRWDSPAPDIEGPEAEWGFEPSLREDVERLAQRQGYSIRRIVIREPEDLSALVSDIHRWWYEDRGIESNRLVVDSFIVMDPWWTLRTGSSPFWMVFNKEPSARRLEEYLDRAGPFDYIHLMLFNHGVDSIGLAPVERWRSLLDRARVEGSFVGLNTDRFPRDFSTYMRYNRALQDIPERYPMPEPMTLAQLDGFMSRAAGDYPVQWTLYRPRDDTLRYQD